MKRKEDVGACLPGVGWRKRPEWHVAGAFVSLGVVTALLAIYYHQVFLGMENPITHSFPITFDYFAYAQNYFQTETNFEVCWKVSALAFGVASAALMFPRVERLSVFRPLHRMASSLRAKSPRFKTATLVLPLALLEAGLLLYGGLMGLARLNLLLSLQVGADPAVRGLVMGPLGPFGLASAAEQDYYFLVLFLAVLAASLYRFASVRRVLQIGALSVIPLPMMVFLFDRIEFNTFFATVIDRLGLSWFSNALLLYLCIGVFALATVYPALRRLASRTVRGERRWGH